MSKYTTLDYKCQTKRADLPNLIIKNSKNKRKIEIHGIILKQNWLTFDANLQFVASFRE